MTDEQPAQVVVTAHAVQRYRQRVRNCGSLDAKHRIETELQSAKKLTETETGLVAHCSSQEGKRFRALLRTSINEECHKTVVITILEPEQAMKPKGVRYSRRSKKLEKVHRAKVHERAMGHEVFWEGWVDEDV